MYDNIDTSLLRTFVTIAETRSFTRSADRLFRTQSAISMQIKRLEDILQCQLFYRAGREVRITQKGHILLKYAEKMLVLNDEIHNEIVSRDAHGEIRLGTSDDYATIFLPEVIQQFSQIYPQAHVNISCGNTMENLERLNLNKIDFCLATTSPEDDRGETLRMERLVWIGSPDFELPEKGPIPLTGFPDGCVCRNVMLKALHNQGRDWRFTFSSNNIGSIHSAVHSGLAISAVEESTVPEGVQVFDKSYDLPDLTSIRIAAHRADTETSGMFDSFYDHLRSGLRRPAYADSRMTAA